MSSSKERSRSPRRQVSHPVVIDLDLVNDRTPSPCDECDSSQCAECGSQPSSPPARSAAGSQPSSPPATNQTSSEARPLLPTTDGLKRQPSFQSVMDGYLSAGSDGPSSSTLHQPHRPIWFQTANRIAGRWAAGVIREPSSSPTLPLVDGTVAVHGRLSDDHSVAHSAPEVPEAIGQIASQPSPTVDDAPEPPWRRLGSQSIERPWWYESPNSEDESMEVGLPGRRPEHGNESQVQDFLSPDPEESQAPQ